MLFSSSPLASNRQENEGTVCVALDIRERKQAEMALRESREHYIKLFKEARAMEDNLRELSNKVLTAQEEERKRVSREHRGPIFELPICIGGQRRSGCLLRVLGAASHDAIRRAVEIGDSAQRQKRQVAWFIGDSRQTTARVEVVDEAVSFA